MVKKINHMIAVIDHKPQLYLGYFSNNYTCIHNNEKVNCCIKTYFLAISSFLFFHMYSFYLILYNTLNRGNISISYTHTSVAHHCTKKQNKKLINSKLMKGI